ncbi:MAG: bifunctional folylpolyglutamate synthase/dihydrofolate synthase [Candidatus Omnitrophica bacterium]|nr:bifunctional folylpolyglutamate synthase/dihydrofolate synthase [Candidatus Omnitrophota bacterium]
MTYQEASQFLFSLIDYETIPGAQFYRGLKLERVKHLLRALGDPHYDLRCIHIAGTKGKGSVAAMLAYVLAAGAQRVGLFTSPHLYSFRERIRILDSDVLGLSYGHDGSRTLFEGMISEEDFAGIIGRVQEKITLLDIRKFGKVTFFEVLTAAALLYFKEKKVDYAVLETGVGGRLDATNLVYPLVSVITGISFDHMHLLGETIEEIAAEKAGIIKPKTYVVIQPQLQPARSVLIERCRALGAFPVEVGIDIVYKEEEVSKTYQAFSAKGALGGYERFRIPLIGRHQLINAATVLAVIDALRLYNLSIYSEAIAEGFSFVKWPVRAEIVSRAPHTILDGAQNAASMQALFDTIERHFGGEHKRLTVIIGLSKEKDVRRIAEVLSRYPCSCIVTRAHHPRAMDPEDLRGLLEERRILTTVFPAPEEAIGYALNEAEPGTIIVITGSLFLAAEARTYFIKTPVTVT